MSSIPWSARPGPCTQGLTLIELMMGLAIAAILATLSAPAFLRQINGSRLSTASSDLMASLALARGEAIRTGMRVTVCRSVDGSTCDTAAPAHWNRGWITFQDINADGVRDPGERLVHAWPAMPAQVIAIGNTQVADRIGFRPSGSTQANGTLRVCNTSASLPDDQRARDLVVIRTGRVVLTSPGSVSPQCPKP